MLIVKSFVLNQLKMCHEISMTYKAHTVEVFWHYKLSGICQSAFVVHKTDTLSDTQSITKDGTSLILRVVKLPDQAVEGKKDCMTHERG